MTEESTGVIDGNHRHGNTHELVVNVAATLEQMFLAVQDDDIRRKLVQRAARQGGLAAALLSSEKRKLRLCIKCLNGTMKVSVDVNFNLS